MLNHKKNIKYIYKKLILIILVLILSSSFLVGPSVNAGDSNSNCPSGEIALQVSVPGLGHCVKGFPEYIKAFYNFFMSIVGILAVIMIMLGGLQWIMAAGNAQKIDGAKTIIISAIMGLVLTFTSYTILNVLNPDVLTLKLNVASINLVEPSGNEVCKLSDDPSEGGELIKDNSTYDTPICGKKYLYEKDDIAAYCYGFTCGDHMNGQTSICLENEGNRSCQTSLHIIDTENKGWGEHDWGAPMANLNKEQNCGKLYYGIYPGSDQEIFRIGTQCGSGDKGHLDKDEYCNIKASEGAVFTEEYLTTQKNAKKNNGKMYYVGRLKKADCDTYGWDKKN